MQTPCCKQHAPTTHTPARTGGGSAAAARLACWVGVGSVVLLQGLMCGVCLVGGRSVVRWLSSNEQVEELTMAIMPVLAFTFVGEIGAQNQVVAVQVSPERLAASCSHQFAHRWRLIRFISTTFKHLPPFKS